MSIPILKVKIFPKPVIRGKMDVRFPANVVATNFLTVIEDGGIYTLGVDYTKLGGGPVSDPATAMVALLDQTTGVYKLVSLASLLTSGIDADLQAIAALTGTGMLSRTANGVWTLRTITGTGNEITVTNGNGVAGNQIISLPSALTFTGKTVTGGAYDNAVRVIVGPTDLAPSITNKIIASSSSAVSALVVGQDTNHQLDFLWNFNATPASASAAISTFGYVNPLSIDASVLTLQGASGGNTNVYGPVVTIGNAINAPSIINLTGASGGGITVNIASAGNGLNALNVYNNVGSKQQWVPGGGNTIITFPAATDTLIGKATIDTLTNKSLTFPTLANPVITGPAPNAAGQLGYNSGLNWSDGAAIQTAVATTMVQTLTNKTLTSPVISNPTITGVMNYGGVTLNGAVTGTGNMVLSNSPTFAGAPAAPTAAVGTNTTQLATTAFVLANAPAATSAPYTVKGNRTGSSAATADLVSPILTSAQFGFTTAPNGTRIDARDSTLTNNTAVYTEGQRSVSSVVNDTIVTMNSVALDNVDSGAGRFVMRSLGAVNGYPASTKGALTRALEAQVLVDSSIPNDANRATWGMEIGLHSQLAGNNADKNVGIYLASSHAGWLPTGVRNDTGLYIAGADGWVNAIRYVSTDNATILFNVDQTGTVSAAAASVGNLVSTNLTILKGTTAGDDAAAGNIGQYIPVVSGVTAITSATQTNVANLPLTAGDWDVYGEVNFYPGSAATIIFDAVASVSLTSATLDQGAFNAGRLSFGAAGIAPGANFNNTVKAGPRRISIPAGPGLVAFLVGYTTFSGGTMSTTGGIRARRVR